MTSNTLYEISSVFFSAVVPAQVGEHEGFFTSFRWGTVGVISLDTLELSLLHDGLAVKAHDSARGLDVKKRMQERGRNEEDLMLGEAQWEMLDGVLANQVRARVRIRYKLEGYISDISLASVAHFRTKKVALEGVMSRPPAVFHTVGVNDGTWI